MLNLGQETEVRMEGKTYTLSKFRVGILEKWRALVIEWEGDPVKEIAPILKDVSPELQRELLSAAQAEKKLLKSLDINSPISVKWRQTPEGAIHFAKLWLEEYHPDIDDMTAIRVFAKLGANEGELERALKNANGTIPPNAEPPAREPGTAITTNSGTTSTAT